MNTCFVIMPFQREFDSVYKTAIVSAAEDTGLKAIRGDLQTDLVIAEGIERGIQEATVCIADLTGLNSNVVYEVAFAISRKKPVVLITRDPHGNLPFDIRQFRVHKYENTPDGLKILRNTLGVSIKAQLGGQDSLVFLLKEMLLPESVAESDRKFVVAASPLSWRHARQMGGGYPKLRRTSSDHVGIRGLIYAFGLISSLTKLPDLVDPGDYKADVCFEAVNCYSIGSPKANPWTGSLVEKFSQLWRPGFAFKANPNSRHLRDVEVDVHMEGRKWFPAGYLEQEHKHKRDFGLVVRGPHPCDRSSMIMLLAGGGAIGTEAACRAVTEQKCLTEIKKKLGTENLNNHHEPFWAVVEMEGDQGGLGETRLETLKVLQADFFQPRMTS